VSDGLLLDPWTGAAILIVMSAIWLALGRYWGRKAANLDGFMLANRNVGLALGTATAVATWITSNTTMLAPQFALELGVWGMLAYCTASIGLFMFAPLAARIRSLMPEGYTSAEFIARRYGNVAWAIFLLLSMFYAVTWMISMAMAGGLLIEALTGIPYIVGMSTVVVVCTIYTLAGGLFAVIGTDFIQSVLVLLGLVAVLVAIFTQVSIPEVHAELLAERPALLDVLFPAALMALFNNLMFGVGEIFHSNVWWSRALAMREGVGAKAYGLAGLIWLPVPVVAGFAGLAAPALGIGVARPDMVGPITAGTVLGPLGSVLVFVVVFASIASSVDSLLAATSDLFTKEIALKWLGRAQQGAESSDQDEQARERKIAGGVVLSLGVLTWLACLPQIGTLAQVLFFAGPMVASMIWPILAGLYWAKTPPAAAVGGMLAGTALGLTAYFAVGWYVGSLVGAVVSAVVVVVGTIVQRARAGEDFDWERLAT